MLFVAKKKVSPNVTHLSCSSDGQVHIIGDLHGQLRDLLHILDEAGTPSPTNKYIFNGDFVDRGSCSTEVLMLLFSFHLAWPESVCLNRGNHEDHAICSQPPPPNGCGGFANEMKSKYDDLMYSMCVEVCFPSTVSLDDYILKLIFILSHFLPAPSCVRTLGFSTPASRYNHR